jgi:hypothetical protein
MQYALKLFWAHLMELLGYVGQVEGCFGPLEDGVNLSARQMHGLCRMYHEHENLFSRTRWTS